MTTHVTQPRFQQSNTVASLIGMGFSSSPPELSSEALIIAL
jgi:hypothetical protein